MSFGRIQDRISSWDTTDAMLAEMFSHDPEAEEFTKTSEKIGFFGNDGVLTFAALLLPLILMCIIWALRHQLNVISEMTFLFENPK